MLRTDVNSVFPSKHGVESQDVQAPKQVQAACSDGEGDRPIRQLYKFRAPIIKAPTIPQGFFFLNVSYRSRLDLSTQL